MALDWKKFTQRPDIKNLPLSEQVRLFNQENWYSNNTNSRKLLKEQGGTAAAGAGGAGGGGEGTLQEIYDLNPDPVLRFRIKLSSGSTETIRTQTDGQTYNYNVDWGDGTITTGATGDTSHTYPGAGTYTVSITGTFPGFRMSSSGIHSDAVAILNWGTASPGLRPSGSMYHGMDWGSFSVPTRFEARDALDTSAVTSLERLMYFALNTNMPRFINQWDTSNVTTMERCFYGTTSVSGRDWRCDDWDTSNVTNMNSMFRNQEDYSNLYDPANNSRDRLNHLGKWDTSNVTNMGNMFYGCSNFNNPIQSWDTSNVTDMSAMFFNCRKFNQSIGSWNTSNVTNMSSMFYLNASFNQPIGSWDTSNVVTMANMFNGNTAFNQPIDSWDVSSVTNISGMFRNNTAFNQPIDSWDVSNVTRIDYLFSGNTAFSQSIDSWDVSGVTTPIIAVATPFKGATKFNSDLTSWSSSIANAVFANKTSFFSGCTNFNGDISTWDMSSTTGCAFMFQNATSFNSDISGWDMSGNFSMFGMFQNATSFNQDISGWNVSANIDFDQTFENATSFNQDISSWQLAQNTSFAGAIFSGASSFDQNLGTEGWLPSGSNIAYYNMFANSGMSTENYTDTLVGWANVISGSHGSSGTPNLNSKNFTNQTGMIFDNARSGGARFATAADARSFLTSTLSWTISGDTVIN